MPDPSKCVREAFRPALPHQSTLRADRIAALCRCCVIVLLRAGTFLRVTELALPTDRLWNQREAAYYLGVSARYLRDSDCPKVLLPGNGKSGQPIVRYDPAGVKAWAARWNTKRVA